MSGWQWCVEKILNVWRLSKSISEKALIRCWNGFLVDKCWKTQFSQLVKCVAAEVYSRSPLSKEHRCSNVFTFTLSTPINGFCRRDETALSAEVNWDAIAKGTLIDVSSAVATASTWSSPSPPTKNWGEVQGNGLEICLRDYRDATLHQERPVAGQPAGEVLSAQDPNLYKVLQLPRNVPRVLEFDQRPTRWRGTHLHRVDEDA